MLFWQVSEFFQAFFAALQKLSITCCTLILLHQYLYQVQIESRVGGHDIQCPVECGHGLFKVACFERLDAIMIQRPGLKLLSEAHRFIE